MGYESFGVKYLPFNDLSAGWFPGKRHNEIPGDISNPSSPIGATYAQNTVWLDGSLQKMFGTSQVTGAPISESVRSIYYSSVLDNTVGNAENKIYADLTDNSPTDITGAVVVDGDIQMDWTQWQFGTDAFVIGTDGTNPPIKWTGTGNADVLGGTPTPARWVERWKDVVWFARLNTEPATVIFSNIGDAETYDSDDNYKFDAPIMGMKALGDQLVVFMEDHIGVLSGNNVRLLTKVDHYVSNYGCTGGHSIRAAKLQNKDVLIFHSKTGWCAFDGSRDIIYLSSPIRNKYLNPDLTLLWNVNAFDLMYATYIHKYGWYVCGIADGESGTMNTAVILDLNKLYQGPDGVYVPHWPITDIELNAIETAKIDGSEVLIFGGDDKVVDKFYEAVYDRKSQPYLSLFVTKIFDNIQTWINCEVNIITQPLGGTLIVALNADQQLGLGLTDILDMANNSDRLAIDFIINFSELGGQEFIYKNAAINTFGRFFQVGMLTFSNKNDFKVSGVQLVLNEIGLDENVDEMVL